MKTRFSIDVPTAVISRSYAGVAVPTPLVGLITARDTMECEVVFTAGDTDITATVLPTGSTLKLGVRLNTSEGDILAFSAPHTMVGGVANCVLDLNTSEVVSLVNSITNAAQRNVKVYFEVEVTTPDGKPQTLAQQQFTMQFEVNEEADEPPTAAAASAATAAAQAAIATTKATEAATSAGQAATSATNAATSATNAANSATAATNQATAAASSATTALNAIAQHYKGLVAGNAVPATLPNAGDYEIITSAGTSQGKTWAFGDWAIYSGTSGVYDQLPAGAVDRTMLNSASSARKPAPGLSMTGAQTSCNATIAATLGTGDFTMSAVICPSSVAGTLAQIIMGDGSGNGTLSLYGAHIRWFDTTSGGHEFTALNVVAGIFQRVTLVRTNGVLTAYIDEKASETFATAHNLTGTAWSVGRYAAGDNFAGTIIDPVCLNRGLSATEVSALVKSGVLPVENFCNAGTQLITGNDSTFASDTGFWTKYGATISGGVCTFPNVNDAIAKGGLLTIGKRYRITVAITSGTCEYNSGAGWFSLPNGSTDVLAYDVTPYVRGATAGASIDTINITPLGVVGAWDLSLLQAASTSAPAMPNVACGSLTWGSGVLPNAPWSGTLPGPVTVPGGVRGTTTNDNAAAGIIGEYVSNTVTSGSAVALTTGTQANITSISLTAGDWDVYGNVGFLPQSTAIRARSIAGISSVSATVPSDEFRGVVTYNTADSAAQSYTVGAPIRRFSLSATTTIYLVAFAEFSGGVQSAYGVIQARRVR